MIDLSRVRVSNRIYATRTQGVMHQQNLGRTQELFSDCCNVTMHADIESHCHSIPEAEPGGPLIYHMILKQLIAVTHDSSRGVIERLKTLPLTEFEGKNVLNFSATFANAGLCMENSSTTFHTISLTSTTRDLKLLLFMCSIVSWKTCTSMMILSLTSFLPLTTLPSRWKNVDHTTPKAAESGVRPSPFDSNKHYFWYLCCYNGTKVPRRWRTHPLKDHWGHEEGQKHIVVALLPILLPMWILLLLLLSHPRLSRHLPKVLPIIQLTLTRWSLLLLAG